jgi:hypothetical protein
VALGALLADAVMAGLVPAIHVLFVECALV